MTVDLARLADELRAAGAHVQPIRTAAHGASLEVNGARDGRPRSPVSVSAR